MSDPVYDDFLVSILKELVSGPLHGPAFVVLTAQGHVGVHKAVEAALVDLVRRGWASRDGADYLSLTEAGRSRI